MRYVLDIGEHGTLLDVHKDYWAEGSGELLEIPRHVRRIGREACSRLPVQTVLLPEGLEEIGTEAFANCPNLRTCRLPDGIQRIGQWAFHWCSLREAIIPAGKGSGPDIGFGAFEQWDGNCLERIVWKPCGFPEGSPGEDAALVRIFRKECWSFPGLLLEADGLPCSRDWSIPASGCLPACCLGPYYRSIAHRAIQSGRAPVHVLVSRQELQDGLSGIPAKDWDFFIWLWMLRYAPGRVEASHWEQITPEAVRGLIRCRELPESALLCILERMEQYPEELTAELLEYGRESAPDQWAATFREAYRQTFEG